MSRMRGYTKDYVYHLEDNLYLTAIRSGWSRYDDSIKNYQIEKLKSNPRFKEIYTEYMTGFGGSYTIIPHDIISTFEGWEDKFTVPDEEGWFLAIVAQSKFCDEKFDNSCRSFNGPDQKWFKDAMLWWEINEKSHEILRWLVENYVFYFFYNIKEFKNDHSNLSLRDIDKTILDYIIIYKGCQWLIDFLNRTDKFKLLYLFYLAKIASHYEFNKKIKDPFKKRLDLLNVNKSSLDAEYLKYYEFECNRDRDLINDLVLEGELSR